jgi:hypothetical protein
LAQWRFAQINNLIVIDGVQIRQSSYGANPKIPISGDLADYTSRQILFHTVCVPLLPSPDSNITRTAMVLNTDRNPNGHFSSPLSITGPFTTRQEIACCEGKDTCTQERQQYCASQRQVFAHVTALTSGMRWEEDDNSTMFNASIFVHCK